MQAYEYVYAGVLELRDGTILEQPDPPAVDGWERLPNGDERPWPCYHVVSVGVNYLVVRYIWDVEIASKAYYIHYDWWWREYRNRLAAEKARVVKLRMWGREIKESQEPDEGSHDPYPMLRRLS